MLCCSSAAVSRRYSFVLVVLATLSFAATTTAQDATAQLATDPASLRVAPGFQVDLIYTVPKDKQGSWVNLCHDPQGRLIVSDQYGGLYRVTPGRGKKQTTVEPIDVPIGEAQGLLWAFDSLYVVVNGSGQYQSGLYRVRDSDGDDQLDQLETLRLLDGGREHGPHAVLLSPDGESIHVVCGNRTKLPELASSRVPQVWDEDNLLPRPYGRGFMKGTPAPGGYICRVDPDGKQWELVAAGFRNQYDAAFHSSGELFTYDADMEWDMNTPWYRPTRVCHVVSGAEFGWRNGGGKWPDYYPDSLPSVVDIGFGSPTGVVFGYGARFPQRYQEAMYICDWSYGKMYAVHLRRQGGSFRGDLEEFVTGTPLPLTDVIINPVDQAMYFTIGGRKVQSALYRVTFTGPAPQAVESASVDPDAVRFAAQRRELETLHSGDHPEAIEKAWPFLASPDRFVRYAARVAIEHRDVGEWKSSALQTEDPQARLTALLALVRQYQRTEKGTGENIDPAPPEYPVADDARHADQPMLLQALGQFDWSELTTGQQLELLRIYALTFTRLGPPNEPQRADLLDRFESLCPARTRFLNAELTQILVYLQSEKVAKKGTKLLLAAPTQEEQIGYAKSLRHLRVGWDDDSRKAFLKWFVRAQGFRGGASFQLFVEDIKKDAVEKLSPRQREEYAEILNAKPAGLTTAISLDDREVVKEWTLAELSTAMKDGLRHRNFERGRRMFSAAKCFACHRFDGEGGAVGPDLTSLAGRFSSHDILESVVEPSKTISDQYQAVQIVTVDGQVIVGRIVNLANNEYRIRTNQLDPGNLTIVNRNDIEEMVPSRTSMMPTGLLNKLKQDEILDLMAYLLSRGDPEHPMFSTGDAKGEQTEANQLRGS